MPLVADWFEVQCYEGGRVLAEEGTWCHSFVMLYEGTLEARGRVYRTNNPKGGLLSLINKGKDNLGNDIKKLEEEKAAAEAAKVARLGDDDEEEELHIYFRRSSSVRTRRSLPSCCILARTLERRRWQCRIRPRQGRVCTIRT